MIDAPHNCRLCGQRSVEPVHPTCDTEYPEWYPGRLVRTYAGRLTALNWSVCRVCDERIESGEVQVLADLPSGRAWVHEACAEAAP